MTIIQKGERMSDLISRQAAIDALEEHLDYLQTLNKDENPTAESKWYGVNWARNTIAELPSAQPTQTNTPNALESLDCISRQAAIEAAAIPSEWDGMYIQDLNGRIREAIEQLPSAQPECTQGCKPMYADVSDTISRQAAIDALGEKPLVWDDLSDFDLGKAAQWSDDVDAIKALPSAQPERIKGRWIDVTKTGGAELWKCSECGELELEDSYFCPNCGSDMRGDEDE